MGTRPRSYGYRFSWSNWITPGVKALVIASAAVFLMQTLVRLFFRAEVELALNYGLGLVPRGVTHGLRIWQPFTYLFLHGGIGHLLINMLFLWMFGCDLERAWGTRRFYFYYFLTGVGAGCINILVKTVGDPHGLGMSLGPPTVGASGAIYGVLLASALMFPDRQIWLIPFPVTIPMRIYVLGAGAIEFFATLGAGADNVSHVTHLGGMLVGYLYLRRGSFFYGLRNRYSDWKRQRLRRKFEVYMREHKDEPGSRPDHWVN